MKKTDAGYNEMLAQLTEQYGEKKASFLVRFGDKRVTAFKPYYEGSKTATAKDFENYSMKELRQAVKKQASRLNSRLASLEKKNMLSGWAYEKAEQMTYDSKKTGGKQREFMKDVEGKPRFQTSVEKWVKVDGGKMYERDRTREELIEQLVQMANWESLKTSTTTGMMEHYEAKFERMRDNGFIGTFDEFVRIATSDAYALIDHYYGSVTAKEITKDPNKQEAVNAFIKAHPEYFTYDNPLNSEGLSLESKFNDWYESYKHDVDDTGSLTNTGGVMDIMTTDY